MHSRPPHYFSNSRRDYPSRHSEGNYSSQRSSVDPTEQKFYTSVAIDPSPRIRLEEGSKEMTMRAMDLICPIGMGQRVWI